MVWNIILIREKKGSKCKKDISKCKNCTLDELVLLKIIKQDPTLHKKNWLVKETDDGKSFAN